MKKTSKMLLASILFTSTISLNGMIEKVTQNFSPKMIQTFAQMLINGTKNQQLAQKIFLNTETQEAVSKEVKKLRKKQK